MTFMEFENKFSVVVRKTEGRSLLAFLLDEFDRGTFIVSVDSIVEATGHRKPNVYAAANVLKEQGLLQVLYKSDNDEHADFTEVGKGRWSSPFYKLPTELLSLYGRKPH